MEIFDLINGAWAVDTRSKPVNWDLGSGILTFTPNGKGAVKILGETSGNTNTIFQTKHGLVKFHSRPNGSGYAVEVKSEPTIITGTHYGIECTVDAKPSASDPAAGIRGGGFIGRLAATYTKTGGSLIGGYSQACNLGTINGAGAMMAGHYALIEDGGVFTSLSHLAGLWVDSHLTKTISGGSADMVYITNNGSTQFDNALYIYAGNHITNLFTIDTASGMVGDAVTSDYTFTKTRLIKVVAGGETGYLVMDVP
jgi:hypothetical protein